MGPRYDCRRLPRMPHPTARVARLAAERRLFTAGPDGPLSVCLVYPNTYAVGMANLGFQAVFRLLAEDPRVSCERAFLPDGARGEWPSTLRSLEHDRAVRDFDIVAFSLSFETDYLHVLDCLGLARIPLWRRERGPDALNDNRYEGSVSWAFLSYRPTNDWLIRAGKQRTPLYLYSETVDVGVTYDFARLPTECGLDHFRR